MKPSQKQSRHLAVWALVAVLLLMPAPPALAANATLVLASLQVLERNYVDPRCPRED